MPVIIAALSKFSVSKHFDMATFPSFAIYEHYSWTRSHTWVCYPQTGGFTHLTPCVGSSSCWRCSSSASSSLVKIFKVEGASYDDCTVRGGAVAHVLYIYHFCIFYSTLACFWQCFCFGRTFNLVARQLHAARSPWRSLIATRISTRWG